MLVTGTTNTQASSRRRQLLSRQPSLHIKLPSVQDTISHLLLNTRPGCHRLHHASDVLIDDQEPILKERYSTTFVTASLYHHHTTAVAHEAPHTRLHTPGAHTHTHTHTDTHTHTACLAANIQEHSVLAHCEYILQETRTRLEKNNTFLYSQLILLSILYLFLSLSPLAFLIFLVLYIPEATDGEEAQTDSVNS